ncbi:MAG: oxidoreductase, family [Nocardioidaceae bacterium]|nr:oxidoreductase, family [Nocardioidaceae bacterium]
MSATDGPHDPESGAPGVAVVTGSAGGIGGAVSTRLHAMGYEVVGVDLVRTDGVDHLALSVGLDITDAEAVRDAMSQVVAQFGRVDVLVNCAGIAHRGSFSATTAKEFMLDVETNLLGTFLMCQAAVFPHMEKARRGRLINIASSSGKTGGVGPVHRDGSGGRSGPGYASSKAAVINLTRWMAREVGFLNLTCNAIAPGPVAGVLTDGHAYDVGDIPMQRLATNEDVAGAVAWLAGADASYVNGTVVDVDGGLVRA